MKNEPYDFYFLEPGSIFISDKPHHIHTVVGCSLSVCIWDIDGHAGGMNHFIYPVCGKKERKAIYGDLSIEHLIRVLMSQGIPINRMRAHIVGGGYLPERKSSIGNDNAVLAENILKKNGIMVINRDTGEATGRKIIFHNLTGEIVVYKNVVVRRTDWYDYGTEEDQGFNRG